MMGLVDVIDSIVITRENNISDILAQWREFDPSIAVFGELTSGNAVKSFLNWSDKNGTIDLHTGDYFSFLVPDVFRQESVSDVTDATITTLSGDVIATYSISSNEDNKKEVKMTFTDFVETHSNITGNLWLLLFVGSVTSIQQKTIDFVINGELAASGEITVNPRQNDNTPIDRKDGFSTLGDVYDGYYIFNWSVDFNMEEDEINGFHVIENFSFEDVIPEDSPHVFLTDEIRQELNILPSQFPQRVGEYKLADPYSPEERYQFFYFQFNATGDDRWYHDYIPLVDGSSSVGIDGGDGLNVSNIVSTEKSFSANLGRLTRPTRVQYCTIATIKLAERALGDPEVVKLIKNTFNASYGENLPAILSAYRFESGGQGLTGDYSFTFTKIGGNTKNTKISENEIGISGAGFSLFLTEDAELASRFAYSDSYGVVTFMNLPEGIYYIRETITPYGYVPSDTIYKVVLQSTGFEIYYGDNFENKLSDYDNKILNRSEYEFQFVLVTLEGIKNLTGQAMLEGMFNFIVKDSNNDIVASGVNATDGSITFSEIMFDIPGAYVYTIEEVAGSYGGITYDNSIFTVVITITDDGEGNLAAQITYPEQGIVFNNSYSTESVPVTLEGTKNLTGEIMFYGMFNFVVKDSNGEIIATGVNTADGNIVFSEIIFDSPGVYSYTVQEVIGTYDRITYDDSSFTVTINITDDGDGNLEAQTNYPVDGIVFNNRSYDDNYAAVVLTGTKNLTGKSLESGMFSFVIKDVNEDVVATGTNAADGSITFSEIGLDFVGEYTFVAEEVIGSQKGITYDNSKYTIIVTVTDDGSGNPIVGISYINGDIVFNNSYSSTIKPCQCYSRSTKCRKSIEGKKIWIDNNNANNTRPQLTKINLIRDGEVYKSIDIDSEGDGNFLFCCLPIWKNSRHKYEYQIDEANVPSDYTKEIEGYNVINTLIP